MSIILDGTTGITTPDLIDSSLTSGRVVYAGASGNLTGSTALTFDGAILGVNGVSVGRGAGAVSTNTAVGASALAANTSGADNTAVGYQAGFSNTTGLRNTASGYQSLYTSSIGSYNTAMGWKALNLSTGDSNTGLGYTALLNTSTGASNTAIGESPLQSNTTGSFNTAVGTAALKNNNTASYNTAIGYQAGYTNVTGATVTYLGYQAGYTATGGNNTFIGTQAGYAVTTGAKNTILGRYDGNQGSLDIRTGSNYVVLSDGDGNPLAYTYSGATFCLQGAGYPQTGTGITFPATQSASSNANTLDDYEEGTWSPVLAPSSSGSITMNGSFTSGKYTKVGRLVVCTASLYVSSVSSPTGNLFITGLPFTVLAPSSAGSFWGSGLTSSANNSIVMRISNSSTEVLVQGFASGAVVAAAPWVKAATEMNVTLTYFV